MRKVFGLTSFFLFLFILQSETANATDPSCTITMLSIETGTSTGFANKTKFSAFGTTEIQLNPQQSRIDIVDETRKTVIKSLGFSKLDKNNFSIKEFGPFLNEGKYHLNLIVSRSRGGDSPLCNSNTIEIVPLPTPTPGGPSITPTIPHTCSPPGRNPENFRACADSNCRPIGAVRDVTVNSPCEPFGVIVPSPTPTPTKAPPLPPCAKWVYFYDDPEGRCKNKDKDIIAKLDTNDYKNNCRFNDIVIPTGNPEYINPDFKTRKCIAIQTGIGEISTEPQGFVKRIFSLVLGIAGGIALILIIISGYRLMASQGNPESITNARQQLVGAIVGLLFIIFSFVILQVIGVDILHIPGFQP